VSRRLTRRERRLHGQTANPARISRFSAVRRPASGLRGVVAAAPGRIGADRVHRHLAPDPVAAGDRRAARHASGSRRLAKLGVLWPQTKACMQPIDVPASSRSRSTFSPRVSSRCWAATMSS
jgi:hypothetical protein